MEAERPMPTAQGSGLLLGHSWDFRLAIESWRRHARVLGDLDVSMRLRTKGSLLFWLPLALGLTELSAAPAVDNLPGVAWFLLPNSAYVD